jgi:hypothetical protein
MATYIVQAERERFEGLPPEQALAKVRELVAAGAVPYLFDDRGDPMGLVQLEELMSRGRA